MRTAVLLPVLAICSACTVVPPQAWTFDPREAPPKVALPAAEVAALTNRLAELRSERDRVRAGIAAERDVWQRQEHYRQLHQVGMELSPLERQLSGIADAR